MIPGSQRNCKPRALGHLGASQLQKPQRASMAQAPGRILLIQPLGTCLHQPPLMALGGSGGLWLPKSFHKPGSWLGPAPGQLPRTRLLIQPSTRTAPIIPGSHATSCHNGPCGCRVQVGCYRLLAFSITRPAPEALPSRLVLMGSYLQSIPHQSGATDTTSRLAPQAPGDRMTPASPGSRLVLVPG